ncbi:MAG TPA: tetratricopeptide repeat protein [Pirellulales bacterium]|nr:tetratricopeptide repeat protein [Pirellulales bacterium]
MRWAAALTAVLLGLAAAPFVYNQWKLRSRMAAARELVHREETPAAIEILSELESRYPQKAEVPYLLGICRRRAGKIQQARDYFKRAGELGWPRKDLLRQDAMTDFQNGDKAAEEYLLTLLKSGCSDEIAGEIYECLVKGYLASLYVREANTCLDYWIEWRPEAPQPRALKAELLHAVGDTNGEVEQYRTLVRLDPKNRTAHLKLGHVLLENRAAADALEEFSLCRELDPDDPAIVFAIAACQRSLGDLEAAESGLRGSLDSELSPAQKTFALVELGQVAIARKAYQEAVDYLEQALQISPNDRTAHYALGLVLSRLKRGEEAEEHFARSVKLDEQNKRLSDLVHVIIGAPDDPFPRCEAGEILLDQGNYREAYIWLQSALRCDTSHQRTHKALADYYRAIGKREAAQQHLAWASKNADPAD